ncbi:hypothetical protein DID88_007153 [Monilinia fructigena]|uniref:Uncharacterized protein n=1 Tax=Monilinia fructigena TaxID=38457 RepID=A0A395J7F4_9HELO|nr:hypothetical protein DID88_007153 [Monilinia fructigena]
MRQDPPDAIEAFVHRVSRSRHAGHGTRFRHAVTDGQAGEVQLVVQLLHQGFRDRGPGRDAGAEGREAGFGDGAAGEELKLGEEHGGDAVEGCGAVGLDALERGGGVEGGGREEDRAAVRGGRHVAEDGAEAVE